MLLDGGGLELSRAPFWAYPRREPVRITTSKRVYERGDPIRVSWWNAPGMRWDWVAVYRVRPGSATRHATPACRAGYCGNAGYLLYEYTGTAVAGSATFTAASPRGDGGRPLRAGLYEVRLLLDDGYSSRARSKRFRIVRPG